jgi:glucosamine--fructose-6-phosphate aminotransferase (isomerizing)
VPTPCSGAPTRRPLVLDELTDLRQKLREIDKIVVACGTAYHAGMVAKYAIEHWTRIPVEVELATSSATATRSSTAHPRRLDQPVRRDHGHPHGGQARQREQGALCWRSATPTARRSRGSPTPCSTPTPARRSRSPRPRPSSPRSPPPTWSACTWRRCAATSTATRPPAVMVRPGTRCPAKIETWSSTRMDRVARDRPLHGRHAVGAVPRPHVGYPVALEGALKLKELAYIHAEGFAAGELKHGPIALIEDGQPVFVVVPGPDTRTSCTRRSSPTSRRSAPAGPARSSSPRRATRTWCPTPTRSSGAPRPTLLAAAADHRAAAGLRLQMATAKGLDVDQPRNLAKSVTVE